ncbi:MAG: carboxylating nicotinate-nucleotide diphosphorylase [Rhodospirillales bacterium]|nr:carboxylating nicotinate-nucleotide diphosphorylase [Rhodospirillales bacterium]
MLYQDTVKAALLEDFGRRGDVTSEATIPADMTTRAVIRARKAGVIAGLDAALLAFELVNPALSIQKHVEDGAAVSAGQDIATLSGSARDILAGERVALNFLGHLSGIATMTATFVKTIEGTNAHICCTRKTTPGLRALEKHAVKCGGGSNHRYGLDDAILIKDNHIAVAGGIGPAVACARAMAGHMIKIEVEVDTLDQLKELLELSPGADAVLLDNMNPDMLARAVKMIDGSLTTEASGGINMDTVRSVSESGVDLISIGALTHSAPVLDLGLDISD